MKKKTFQWNDQLFQVTLDESSEGSLRCTIDEQAHEYQFIRVDEHTLLLRDSQGQRLVHTYRSGETVYVCIAGEVFTLEIAEREDANHRPGAEQMTGSSNEISAPMPGKLLKLFVSEGQTVQAGEPLFIVEAMKMENEVKSPRDGVIAKINFQENELVSVGEAIVEFET